MLMKKYKATPLELPDYGDNPARTYTEQEMQEAVKAGKAEAMKNCIDIVIHYYDPGDMVQVILEEIKELDNG